MKFGIWTPLPHTIRPEPRMDRAIAEVKSGISLAGRTDGTFEFAYNVVRRADELGFDTTLIAERFLGPDLSAWVLASALAMVTNRIELMVAVHPRSEEHTSELQSLRHLVCRLLLEKKN